MATSGGVASAVSSLNGSGAGAAPPPPKGSTEAVLDNKLFSKRIGRLFGIWDSEFEKAESAWHKLDALILLSGKQDEERPMPKTDQLHLWLLGYVFPETLFLLLKDRTLIFLTGPKKLGVLRQLSGHKLNLIDKNNQDGNKENLDNILNLVRKQEGAGSPLRLGRIKGKNEAAVGPFGQSIETLLSQGPPHEVVAMDHQAALLLSIHDDDALECMKKAATLAVRLAEDVMILRIEDVLDNEATESHSEIVSSVEKALDDPKKQERWKAKFHLEPDHLDFVHVNVQSGPQCDLRPSVQPSTSPLCTGPGTILLTLGTKYQDYTANVARTLLFNTPKEIRQSYQSAFDALDYAISVVKPGKPFNEVYEVIRSHIEEKCPKLLPYMTKTFGHTLSIGYRESSLSLNGNSPASVEVGMVFNISIGFANIPSTTKTSNSPAKYSIWLADSILVRDNAPPLVLTADLDRKIKSVNYEFSDATENAPAKGAPAAPSAQKKGGAPAASKKPSSAAPGAGRGSLPASRDPRAKAKAAGGRGAPASAASSPGGRGSGARSPRGTPSSSARSSSTAESSPAERESVVLRDRLMSRNRATNAEENEKLLARQQVLRKKKLEEIRDRFKDGGGTNLATAKRAVKKMSSLTAYRDTTDYPKDLKPGRLNLDLVKESLLVPVPEFGHVPFHVSTIRNVFCQAEDKKFHVFRIQFQVPGTIGFGYKADANPYPELTGPNKLYLKELIFKSSNPSIMQMYKSLKELQKRVKQRAETGDTSQDIAISAPLDLNRKGAKRVILKSVMIKTSTHNRRVAGTLEAHLNGFRFSGGRSEVVDINYDNVKHAIFQPCENELLVLIHLHLKHPILITSKKASDVQFYTEVGSQTDDLDQRRGRSTYDPDEIGEEQREREMKRRLNIEFKRFVEAAEELAKSSNFALEFDLPFRDLGFYGVPKNGSLLILPTSKCLVQLSEWPVFVLTLEEIEIVCFERVIHGLREFDMVIVFKDYARPVQHITTIPVESLDVIKRWLNELEIVWYESRGNLNWSEILKTITEDVSDFVEEGGFAIFLGDDPDGGRSEGESDSDDDDDEEYRDVSSSESSEDFSDDDEDEAKKGSGDEDSDDDSEDSEDEDETDEDESLADENGGSSGGSSGDDEDEEGLSWDELERRTKNEERQKQTRARKRGGGDDSDASDESDRRRVKKKTKK